MTISINIFLVIMILFIAGLSAIAGGLIGYLIRMESEDDI